MKTVTPLLAVLIVGCGLFPPSTQVAATKPTKNVAPFTPRITPETKSEPRPIPPPTKPKPPDTKPVEPPKPPLRDFTKTPGTAPLVAKPKRPRQTMSELRAWLEIFKANQLEGKDNTLANENMQAMPELPYIRTRCREMFKRPNFDEGALDALRDWLCLTFGFKQAVAEELTLEEIEARLKLASP